MTRKANSVALECIHTHRLLKTLKRLNSSAGGYDTMRWKRALYHALGMANVASDNELAKVRETLGLP